MKDMMFTTKKEMGNKLIMPHIVDETSCPMRHCNKCDQYKKEFDKYKKKYDIAKSGLTDDERYLLIELLANEQIKHLIPKNKYESEKYSMLEELKAKIRIV